MVLAARGMPPVLLVMAARPPVDGSRPGVSPGSKAGGPDYLLEFSEPRVVCENTTRHGVVV